jgi:hypothetical protein
MSELLSERTTHQLFRSYLSVTLRSMRERTTKATEPSRPTTTNGWNASCAISTPYLP